MKFSLVFNKSFGIALSLVFCLQAQAQLTGLGGLTGQTQGLGGAASGFGGSTGGATGGATNTKLPGSFGGPGTTGVSIYPKDLTTLNPSTAFSNGTSVSGAATGGVGGIGQTGSGATPFGTNAFSSNATTGGFGAAGGLGAGGFGGGGLGRGFGGGRLGGLGGIGGLGGLGGGGAGNASAQAKKMIRPIVKVDIETERPSSASQATSANSRLGRIPLPKKLQGVTSSVDGDMIVLRGQVATESDKRLVERLVKLEPGIDSVRNEVTVLNSPLERIQAAPSR